MIKIRAGTEEDLPRVAAFGVLIHEASGKREVTQEDYQGYLCGLLNAGAGVLMVAEEDGDLLGSLVLEYQRSAWTGEPAVCVTTLYVVPGAPTKTAMRLMRAGVEVAKAAGIEKVLMAVSAENDRRAWKRLGLQPAAIVYESRTETIERALCGRGV